MPRFKHGTDYKAEFERAVNGLIDKNIEDRTERIRAIDALIDEYVDAIGSAPDPVQLERLADYILKEELTDASKNKVRREEYPIFSEWQLARRKDGRHRRKENAYVEVPLEAARTYSGDGRNYRVPKRRRRRLRENIFMDEKTKSRNRERRRKYREFTKPGPVITYKLEEREK